MQVDERLKEKEPESIKLINGRQTAVKKKFLSKLQVTLNSEKHFIQKAAWGETMRLPDLFKYN